jgi:hypothetical protein
MAMAGEIVVIDTEDCLARLYDRFSARLYRFALRMARDESEANGRTWRCIRDHRSRGNRWKRF